MPSVARQKLRKARIKPLCVCGHLESNHRGPLDAYTGVAVSTKKVCRAQVAVLRVNGRQRISVTSPCPCAGWVPSGDFTEV